MDQDQEDNYFSIPMLNFNVTLIGTNDQFDNVTLSIVKDTVEGFLYDGLLLKLLDPSLLSRVALLQESRSKLFPGSLVNSIEYAGQVYFSDYEWYLNTRQIQIYQLQILDDKAAIVEELENRLKAQNVTLSLDDIMIPSVSSIEGGGDDDDDDDSIEDGAKRIPAAVWATVLTIAVLAAVAFACFVQQKSTQIKAHRLQDKKEQQEDGAQEGDDQMEDETATVLTIQQTHSDISSSTLAVVPTHVVGQKSTTDGTPAILGTDHSVDDTTIVERFLDKMGECCEDEGNIV